MEKHFSIITETPGIGATREQLSMLYTRYRFALEYCRDKDILEVACGSGQGLGYLSRAARRVVGGDIDEQNLRLVEKHYAESGKIEIKKLDAHVLPFEGCTFDVIILYEAIYYLEKPDKFFAECRRILRPNGILLLSTVNKEWADFNPSPFSTRYWSARELKELIEGHGFDVEFHGAFRTADGTFKAKIVSIIRQLASRLRLIPKSMKGKEFLKRIFLGRLSPLPSEIFDGMANEEPLSPLSIDTPCLHFKVIYVKGSIR